MKAKHAAIADELEDLLDRERAILLAGKVQDLANLTEYKTKLLHHLSSQAGGPGLRRIQSKAQRNARLLQAAGSGIRSVADRVAALREGPKSFATYGANGSKRVVGGAGKTVERRA